MAVIYFSEGALHTFFYLFKRCFCLGNIQKSNFCWQAVFYSQQLFIEPVRFANSPAEQITINGEFELPFRDIYKNGRATDRYSGQPIALAHFVDSVVINDPKRKKVERPEVGSTFLE